MALIAVVDSLLLALALIGIVSHASKGNTAAAWAYACCVVLLVRLMMQTVAG